MGNNDVYMETFRSPFGCRTKEQAEYVLNEIRRTHSADDGWFEISAGVERRKGKWYAWRQHAKDRTLVIHR